MIKIVLRALSTACAAFLFQTAAMADITNQSVTLSAGGGLNLDTGTTVSSGGDFTFSSAGITFQGKAKGGNLGNIGSAGYSALTLTVLQGLSAAASTAPIPSSQLVVGDVFAVMTNGGNVAKVLVTSSSSSSLGLQFTTYGTTGGGTAGGPTITGVVNNYSFIPPGFPNSGISPGEIITIFGSNLGPAPPANLTLNSSAGPAGLPNTQNGVSISVDVNGKTVVPAIYYAISSQIAAVLPSGTPTGTGTVTVTYNGVQSNKFSVQIVPSSLGLDTYYGTGKGLVTATNAVTGALFTPTNSAAPGQTIVLWGSGLGADTADSDTVFTTTPHAVNQSSTHIYFGGVEGAVGYAGSSGYPGLNQINVTIPSSVTTGCAVSVVGVVGNVASNFGTLPINPGGGECHDALGFSGSQVGTLSGQGTVKSGSVFVGQLTSNASGGPQTTNIASATFASSTGVSYAGGSFISIGSCIVNETASGGGSATVTGLDAGNVSVQGPAGTSQLQSLTKGTYLAQLPANAIPSTGGTFAFSGTGGSDVGAFNTSITLPNPLLNWTNQSADATINRSQGVLTTWTGGASGTYVLITGSSSGSGVSGSFTCFAPQSALQFMVPSYVTSTLPAGNGSLLVENSTIPVSFSASGIDVGIAAGLSGTSINAVYQ